MKLVNSNKIVRSKFFVFLTILLMFLVVALYVSFRPIKVSAETNQTAIPQINVGYDTYLNPVTNDTDGWYDTYSVYTTSNYAYIYIWDGLVRSDTSINSVILTLAFEWTSENNIWYTNNQDNECIAEFTTLSNPTFNNSLDVMLFKYYVPHYDNLGYGEDSWCSFYTDIDYSYNDYLVLRIKRAWYNALDTDWYPRIVPLSIDMSNTQYYFDYGYNQGYNDGKTNGYSEGYDRGYYYGELAGESISSADYGINDLLFSVFDAPFQVMYNTFSFTIFGVTFWSIIVSLLVILVLLWVVKRFFR